jgi:transposase-like protein
MAAADQTPEDHDLLAQQEPSIHGPSDNGARPCLWIDATYLKVRQNGRIVSVAVIIAVGVNSDGRREVLGRRLAPPSSSHV